MLPLVRTFLRTSTAFTAPDPRAPPDPRYVSLDFGDTTSETSTGTDVRLLDWLTLNTDFLGRSDVARPDTIDHPAFVQIERNDVLQVSTGLKVSPLQRVIVFFNALLPLNREGLHSDHVLACGVERVF